MPKEINPDEITRAMAYKLLEFIFRHFSFCLFSFYVYHLNIVTSAIPQIHLL